MKSHSKRCGFRASNRIVVTGNTGQNFDLLNRNVTPIAAAGAQNQLAVYQRRLPSLILRTALQRAATLRYLGEDTLGGAKHHVITFVHQDPVQMSLYVDATTNLLTKYEMIYPDTVTGDDASELSFADYRKVGALMVPSTFMWKQAGEVTAKWTYDVAFDPQLTDPTFDVKTDGFRVQAAAAPRAVAVEKLGEGVYLVTNLGGGGYQGDMFFAPFDGQPLGFAQEATQHFAVKVRELGFNVDKLAGVHGRVATMTELEQSLELAKRIPTGTADDQRK